MPVVAIVVGVVLCILSVGAALAYNLVALIVLALGLYLVYVGARAATWSPWHRRGPPPSY